VIWRQRGRGFSAIEILVALAIIATLAAVAIPFYASYSSRALGNQIATNLRALANAIQSYRDDVGVYPLNVKQLIVKPVTTDTDLCGVSLSSTAKLAGWNGPYLSRDISSTPLIMETDTLFTTFTRSSTSPTKRNELGTLSIAVYNTSSTRALEVDKILDGDRSATTGSVIWGIVGPRPQLTYNISVAGC
jgi:prepilin-type N-terminal cleavage/methylation domain-containing protein